MLDRTIRQMREQTEGAVADEQAELKAHERELARHVTALKKAVTDPDQVAVLQEKIEAAQKKVTVANEEIQRLQRQIVDPAEVTMALSAFDPVWEQLSPKEQGRLIHLLVERVDYDGAKGTVSITFRPGGIKTLAKEQEHEVAA